MPWASWARSGGGGSADAGWDQVVQYIGAVCMVPIIFMLIWTWNFIRLPAKDSARKDLKIAELKNKLSDRANFEIKFGDLEPFYLRNGSSIHWNVGVLNTGPAVAENVGITLLSISPKPEKMEQGILDCPMQLQRVSRVRTH